MSGTAVGVLFSLGLAPLPASAQSLPSGGSVTSGSATITTSGSNLLVLQSSQNAVISWQDFSVGGGASAHFENGTGATLNRVTGNLPSTIDGSLTATGSLYLINPAGVAVGTGGMVRTGGSFVASTHDAADADFLDGGDLTLKGDSKAGIVNRGFVASLSGDVVLTARRVENSGTIEAPNGSVGLLGGYEVELHDTSLADGKFAVKLGGPDTEVVNTGTVRAAEVEMRANGGSVQALAGNTKAIVKATGVKKVGGRIFLTAGAGGTVKVTQKMVARRAATPATRTAVAALPDAGPLPAARPDFSGGEVHVAGGSVTLGGAIDAAGAGGDGGAIVAVAEYRLELTDTAALNASGANGGLVLLGGDYQGGGNAAADYWATPLGTTAVTSVAAGATIAADGTEGAGGHVVVWSNDRTDFAGAISATGATQGGDAEVSGKATLAYTGFTNLSAQNGAFGTLLLDPYNVTIASGTGGTASGGAFTANADDSVLGADTLLAALDYANVTVSTGTAGGQAGEIAVDADLNWFTNATLTLQAAGDIALDNAVTARAGGLTLDAGGTIVTGANGTVEVARFTLQNGDWYQDTATLPAFAAGDFRLGGGSFLRAAGGDGSAGNPYLLADIYGVQGMATHLSDNFALAGDIDASGTQYWWDGAGFVPVGANLNGFTATFDGRGHVISGLTVNRPSGSYAGLFGAVNGAAIANVGLENVAITGGQLTGGLAGYQANGSITQSWASGSVSGTSDVGGLVGYQYDGSITQSWASGSVSGQYVGGLVGYQSSSDSRIEQSWAGNSVTATGDYANAGGLVGSQYGAITQSYATGAVTANGKYASAGGLVGGEGGGKIEQSFATGSVTASGDFAYAGGLAGYQAGLGYAGTIDESWASGKVEATGAGDLAGGLVGYQGSGGSVTRSYWDKETTGQANGYGAWTGTGTFSATGLTTADARNQASYPGWDFATVWYQAGDMRPILRDSAGPTAGGAVQIYNAVQLQLMGANLAGSYALARDIDASATDGSDAAGIWGAGGFVPVGGNLAFAGTLDGQDHVISGLTVNRASEDYAGLFGYVQNATIRNVGIENAAITGHVYVGGLVGYQLGGSISQSWVDGSVTSPSSFANVGGLVGYQPGGTIDQSWTSGNVGSTDANADYAIVGGLVGLQESGASITRSWSDSSVTTAGVSSATGGLVGTQNYGGDITQSWANGPVTASGDKSTAGGLVGNQNLGGSIGQSWASGPVTQSGSLADAGGLVGVQAHGSVTQSFATGAVTANSTGSDAGGLVGAQVAGGLVDESWASGKVEATQGYDGGLIGYRDGSTVTQSYWDKDTTGQADGSNNTSDNFDATGLSTADARKASSYSGWDFSTVWYQAGDMRPILRSAAGPEVGGIVQVSNLMQLQLMGADLAGSYALTGDINASMTDGSDAAGIWGAGGFVPVGDGSTFFTGMLDGQGHVISGLTIDRPAEANVGLFAQLGGSVENLDLTGADINGGQQTGGLAGVSQGSISRVSVSGAVVGNSPAQGVPPVLAGGLTGLNSGTIAQSSSAATVTLNGLGDNTIYAGGLAGQSSGAITDSFASGDVTANGVAGPTGGGITGAGGLVGQVLAGGTLTGVFASGDVSALGVGPFPRAGGLVADNGGTILQAYATGATIETDPFGIGDIGGLVAHNSGSISQTYATGLVNTGVAAAGGLVGINLGTVAASFWDATTTAQSGSAGGTPLATAQFQDTASFVADAGAKGWDFASVWAPPSAGYYPTLYALSRVVAVAAPSFTRTYGDADPADLPLAHYYGLRPGKFLRTPATLGSLPDAAADAGAYAVTASGGATTTTPEAYRFVTVPGTLTVTPRPITVTAIGGSSTYGDSPADPGLSATNLASGDDVTALNGLVNSFGIGPTTDAGTYTLTVTGTLTNPNYQVTGTGTGTWTVDRAALTVTASDGTMTYGDPVPGLSYSASGWLNGQGDALLGGVMVATDAAAASDVGTGYVTSASGGTLSGAAAGNYTISYVDGHFAVTARPITVTAGSGQSKVYGEDDPVLTYGVTSGTLVSGQGFAGALDRAPGETVAGGPYAIGLGSLHVDDGNGGDNYLITYVGAEFAITPRPITVTADDQHRPLGQPDPTLTWTITAGSLARFDTVGGVFSGALARDPGEAVGTYAIVQNTLAADANYTMDFVPGAFTIEPVQYTGAAALERQRDEAAPLLLSASDGGPCVEGILGPDCVAYVNPANRNLGPYVDVTNQD